MQISKNFFNQKRFHIGLNLAFIIYLFEKTFSKTIKKFNNPVYKTNLKRRVSKSNIFKKRLYSLKIEIFSNREIRNTFLKSF